jgi:hypothetical protein
MKTYRGHKFSECVFVSRDNSPESVRRLDPRLDLANHSPTGFAWGYGGSGPAQLALALLADVLGDDEAALRYHQEFKFKVIGRLPQNAPWTLTEQDIRDNFNLLRHEEHADGEEWGA